MFEGTKPYFTSTDIQYKINLSTQVDRIAMLLSTRIEANVMNVNQAFKMLVAAQRNAADALEAMLTPYRDKEYNKALEELEKKYNGLMEDKNEHKAIAAEQDFVEKKFALLIQNMDRENLLLTRSKVLVKEGFDEVEEVK